MNKGIVYAVGAYLTWGVLPVYWKALQGVPAAQILCHRIAWSFLMLAGLISIRKSWQPIRMAFTRPKTMLLFTLATLLLAANWLTYIWGVNAGFIVETSLGYFINPLVNVSLGVIIFREQLRPAQWLAIGLAFCGVLYLTLTVGRLPWIALVLAFTFAFYALAKKTSPLGSLPGLTLETAILFIPAITYLVIAERNQVNAFTHQGLPTDLLLIFTGLVTALPLVLFGSAAQRIHLSTLGLLQYLAPTLQFLIGVFLYHEPFTRVWLVGFLFIWLALIIYSTEGFLNHQKAQILNPSAR